MKRVKKSGASFRKKKEAREEELKKNEGAILKFVNIFFCSSHSLQLTKGMRLAALANLYLTRKKKRQLNLNKVIKKSSLKVFLPTKLI